MSTQPAWPALRLFAKAPNRLLLRPACHAPRCHALSQRVRGVTCGFPAECNVDGRRMAFQPSSGLRNCWQVLATAASNIAVDNLVERLAAAAPRLALVRTGHAARLLPSVRAPPSVNHLAAVGHTAAAASKLTLAHADRSLEAIWVIALASMQCARPLATWRAGMPCMHQPLALTSLWRTDLTRCASYQLMVHSDRSEKGGTGMGPRCSLPQAEAGPAAGAGHQPGGAGAGLGQQRARARLPARDEGRDRAPAQAGPQGALAARATPRLPPATGCSKVSRWRARECMLRYVHASLPPAGKTQRKADVLMFCRA